MEDYTQKKRIYGGMMILILYCGTIRRRTSMTFSLRSEWVNRSLCTLSEGTRELQIVCVEARKPLTFLWKGARELLIILICMEVQEGSDRLWRGESVPLIIWEGASPPMTVCVGVQGSLWSPVGGCGEPLPNLPDPWECAGSSIEHYTELVITGGYRHLNHERKS